jgi:hypothetical protein
MSQHGARSLPRSNRPASAPAAAADLAASLDAPLHLALTPSRRCYRHRRWRAAATPLHARADDARRQLTAAAATLVPGPANLHVAKGPVPTRLRPR